MLIQWYDKALTAPPADSGASEHALPPTRGCKGIGPAS